MSTVLSFDTSADYCAAALVRDGVAVAAESVAMSRGHAEALVPLVQDLCAGAKLAFSDIDMIGTTVGPGSFTGVRTGIAAAKGFALAADCPAIGVSSLHAVAFGVRHDGASKTLVLLDTRRDDFFVQLFLANAEPAAAPRVLDAAGVRDLLREHAAIVTGNALDRWREVCDPADLAKTEVLEGAGVPDPVDVATLAERILDTVGVAPDTLSPLYLRAPEAKIPPGGGRLKMTSDGGADRN